MSTYSRPQSEIVCQSDKKKLTNLSRGGGRPVSHCRNLEPNEKHTQKKLQIQASALQKRTLRDLFFFWPSFVSFVLLPLTFTHPLLPLQTRAPLLTGAAVGAATLGDERYYLITLLRRRRQRRRAHLGAWHLEGPVTFTEVPACLIAARVSARQTAKWLPGSRSGEQGENLKLSAKVASLQTLCTDF